jgi:hypothetical protein
MFTPKSYGAYGAVKSLKKLKKPNMNKASLGFQPDDLGDGMLLDNNAEEKYRARRRAKVDAQIEFDKDAPFRRRLEETLATGKDPKKRNYSYQEMVAHPFRTADKVMKKDEKFRSDRENEKKYGY